MARVGGGTRREGAVQSRTSFSDRYHAWLRHHRLSAADSLQRLLDKPWSSLLTWLVIAIAMALPVGMNVALENVRSASTDWDRPAQISLFLQSGVGEQAARQLQLQLASREDIAGARLISSADALAEFRQLSGFGDLLDSLDKNPLPNLILVSPGTGLEPNAIAGLQAQLLAMQEVEEAVLDMEWLQRLSSLMALGRRPNRVKQLTEAWLSWAAMANVLSEDQVSQERQP